MDARYVAQGSAEWFTAKLGKASASNMGKICERIKPSKGNEEGYSSRYKAYMKELLYERLTGVNADHFVTPAMAWGADAEEIADAAYCDKNGVFTESVGFWDHPTITGTGASPDRLVKDIGIVEYKDPTTGTHLNTLIRDDPLLEKFFGGDFKDDNKYQMLWEYECCPGRKWVDFVSFDPRLPENLRYYQERFIPFDSIVLKDKEWGFDEILEDMRAKVKIFLAELDAMEAKVRAYKGA